MKPIKTVFTYFKLILSHLMMVPIIALAANHDRVMIVVGQDFTNRQPPLLVALTGGSAHWAVKTMVDWPLTGRFLSANCTGGGLHAVCLAAGQNFDNNQLPPFTISTNGGSSWSMLSIQGVFPRFFFMGISCTGNDKDAVCVATGHNPTANMPFLVTSMDGGNHWTMPMLPAVLTGFMLSSTSCTGRGRTAICVVGATYQDDDAQPRLIVSTDGGHYWAMKTISGLSSKGLLTSVSCTGSNSNAVCTAVGKDVINARPLVIVSTDGGRHWAVETIPGFTGDGFLMSTSCTGSGRTAVCTAAGKDITYARPLLITGTEGGRHWAVQRIPGLSEDGIFNSTSCAGNGNTAICIAAGENLVTGAPLLVTRSHGGNDWKIQTIQGIPIKGLFLSTGCKGNNTTTVCIAAGQNLITNAPMLVQSVHHVTQWVMPSMDHLPLDGVFCGTGIAMGQT